METSSLTTGSLPRHIRRIALPMSVGFFFNTMYNVVDSFYAGRISTDALAAMALSFPVFFIIVAVSEGLARGASALIANAIGEGNSERERAYSGQVFSLGVVSAVVVTVVGLSASEWLFRMMGASGDYLQLALEYMRPMFCGAVLFILSSMCNAILLANGDSKTFGVVLVSGFFLNLVLDPWFLYGGFGLPAMGISGIALATVLIQLLGCLYLMSVVVRRGYVTLRCLKWLMPQLRIFGEILRQGVPTCFNMMSIALGFFVTTYFLQFYGEPVVAAFGVGTRIEQIFLLPAIGLNTAIISIVGQNNGAKNYARVRECVRLCARYGLIMISVASVVMYAAAEPLVRVFTSDEAVVYEGVRYTRIAVFTQWAYVMGFVYIGFLQALKRPMYGFVESIVRKICLPLLVFTVMVRSYSVGITTLWWGMVLINVLMACVTIWYGRSVLKKVGSMESE